MIRPAHWDREQGPLAAWMPTRGSDTALAPAPKPPIALRLILTGKVVSGGASAYGPSMPKSVPTFKPINKL